MEGTDRERVELLVKDVHLSLRLPVLDVVVDGERDALDRVLQIGLAHRALVHEDGGAGVGLLEGPLLVEHQLTSPPLHSLCHQISKGYQTEPTLRLSLGGSTVDGGSGSLHEDGLGFRVEGWVRLPVLRFSFGDVLEVGGALGSPWLIPAGLQSIVPGCRIIGLPLRLWAGVVAAAQRLAVPHGCPWVSLWGATQ